jgi:sugar lactone lactonase YvrE
MKRMQKKMVLSIAIGIMVTILLSCNNNDDSGPTPEAYTKVELFMGTGFAGLGELGKGPLETPVYLPHDITIGPDGLHYILDWNNHRILVVDKNEVGLVIGNGELGDASNGVATEISLNHPTNVSFNPQGDLILSAWHNSKIMRLDMNTGIIEAIVGDGRRLFGGDGAMAIDAILDIPNSTAFDATGRMFISDQGNNRIRVVNTNGIIETYAGNGDLGFGGDGGPATQASLFTGGGGQAAFPAGKIAVDSKGNVYIPDTGNARIRKVNTQGIISTIAGNGEHEFFGDSIPAVEASLFWPSDIAIDSDDNIYFADSFNHCIRKIDDDGMVTTFVGTCGVDGSEGLDGKPREIKLDRPYGIAFDSNDNLYIADTQNHRVLIVKKFQ